MAYELIGAIGAALILGAWVFETYESVKKHKGFVDLRFAAVYAMGNIGLLTYAWLIRDPVFLTVNAAILGVVLFEIAYTINKLKRGH
jgi:lipid-A-disaccharide synthase-like uncharacterized protein